MLMTDNKICFYRDCIKDNLFNLEDEYESQKINLLAKKYGLISKNESLTEKEFLSIKESYELFLEEDKIAKENKRLCDLKDKEKAKATKIDSVYIDFSDVKDKRRKEINKLIEPIKDCENRSDEDIIKGLYLLNGGGEAKLNPYVMGGISQGIGGAAVGLASYADTVADNARIDRNNQEAMIKTFSQKDDVLKQLHKTKARLRGYKEELEKLDVSYVSNDHDLAKYILAIIIPTISETGCLDLDILLAVDTDKIPKMSRDVELAIDGEFVLAVYDETMENLLLETTIQLPMYGIMANKSYKDGYFVDVKKIIPDAGLDGKLRNKYKFTIENKNLGLIETSYSKNIEKNPLSDDTTLPFSSYFKEDVYRYGKSKRIIENSNSVSEIKDAVQTLMTNSAFMNSEALISRGLDKITALERKEESVKIERQTAKRKRTKTIAIVSMLIIALAVFALYYSKVMLPKSKYNNAISLYNNGDYENAYKLFSELNDYEESNSYAENASMNIMLDNIINNAQVEYDFSQLSDDFVRENTEKVYLAAQAIFVKNNYSDAATLFQKCGQHNDANHYYYYCMAKESVSKHNYKDAINYLMNCSGFLDSNTLFDDVAYLRATTGEVSLLEIETLYKNCTSSTSGLEKMLNEAEKYKPYLGTYKTYKEVNRHDNTSRAPHADSSISFLEIVFIDGKVGFDVDYKDLGNALEKYDGANLILGSYDSHYDFGLRPSNVKISFTENQMCFDNSNIKYIYYMSK